MPDPEEALAELLLSLFSSSELRRFVRFGFGEQGRAVDLALPGRTASPAAVAHAVVEQLQERGLVGPGLWQQLKESRPYRVADIERVQEALASRAPEEGPENSAPSTEPTPPAKPASKPKATFEQFTGSGGWKPIEFLSTDGHPHTGPIRVFLCYSRKDTAHAETFIKRLKPLERNELIKVWYDRHIPTASDWDSTLESKLRMAEIFVLLATADSLASDYCTQVEIPYALERRDKDPKFRFIIVHTDFTMMDPELNALQAANDPSEPISAATNMSKAWYQVTLEIVKVAEKTFKATRT